MARGPEQAVLDHIARVRQPRRPPRTPPTARAPWTADLRTIEILKERHILGRRVYIVGFEADHVRAGRLPMTIVVRAERVAGLGWVARGISASALAGEPELSEPRVLLGGSWGRFGFCGGGKICAPIPEIVSARLRFPSGIVLEDDTEGGWVVFFTDSPVERPEATVELLDADAAVVASHVWPAGTDLPDALRRRIPLAAGRTA
jgi:hypothetical protein